MICTLWHGVPLASSTRGRRKTTDGRSPPRGPGGETAASAHSTPRAAGHAGTRRMRPCCQLLALHSCQTLQSRNEPEEAYQEAAFVLNRLCFALPVLSQAREIDDRAFTGQMHPLPSSLAQSGDADAIVPDGRQLRDPGSPGHQQIGITVGSPGDSIHWRHDPNATAVRGPP